MSWACGGSKSSSRVNECVCGGKYSVVDREASVGVAVNVVKPKIMWSSSAKVNGVLLLFLLLCVVVATSCVAIGMICLQDVSLMYKCVESAHEVEGGAPGQRTWHM
jgi:hypothetical protein